MATHSNILAWRIPWTEEPGGLQSMGVAKELDMTEPPNNKRQCSMSFPTCNSSAERGVCCGEHGCWNSWVSRA